MKKITIICMGFLFIHFNTSAQSNGIYVEKNSFTDPIEYNNYLVDFINVVDRKWTAALDETELSKAMKANSDLKSISGKILQSLKKLQAYSGETAFKTSVVTYITHMNNVSKKELPAFLKIVKSKGTLTAENEKKAEALIPILDERRERLFADFERTQAAFAADNGFTIEGK